jgi:hypothetical protein
MFNTQLSWPVWNNALPPEFSLFMPVSISNANVYDDHDDVAQQHGGSPAAAGAEGGAHLRREEQEAIPEPTDVLGRVRLWVWRAVTGLGFGEAETRAGGRDGAEEETGEELRAMASGLHYDVLATDSTHDH